MELFREDESFTRAGQDFDNEVSAALKPIFDKWVAKGAKVRELSYIAQSSVTLVELPMIMLGERNEQ